MKRISPRAIDFLITLVLIALPFMWWCASCYNLGGDDIKFDFVSSGLQIKNILSGNIYYVSNSSSTVLTDASNLFFLLLLYTQQHVLPFLNSQHFVYALILVGGFWSTKYLLQLLSYEFFGEFKTYLASICALIYVVSSPTIFTLWSSQLPALFYVFTFPLCVFLFIKAVSGCNYVYSVYAGVAISLSPSPYGAFPWLFGAVLINLPLLIWLLCRFRYKILTNAFLTLVTIFITNLHLFYIIYYFGLSSSGMFQPNETEIGKHIFTTLGQRNTWPNVIFGGAPSWTYEIFSPDFFSSYKFFQVISMCGILCLFFTALSDICKKNIHVSLAFLCSLSYSTILFLGGLNWSDYLAKSFDYLPQLAMFRNSYDKFSIGYSFAFSIYIYTISMLAISKQK